MRRVLAGLLLALTLLLPGLPAASALVSPGPEERLDDPEMEARARHLYRELRCVVCQSQSIDESNAPLAADMRGVVRERLLAGDSNAQVKEWLQARYGDYVLMMPPVQANTLALWLMPFLVLFGGGVAMIVFVRTQRSRMDRSDEDDADLAAALSDEEGLS